MKVRKVRKKCEVRGCKNIHTYSLTKGNQFGNSIIICEDCLREALDAVEAYKAKANEGNEPATDAQVDGKVAYINIPNVENVEDLGFVCPNCGKKYKTEAGLMNHLKTCQAE